MLTVIDCQDMYDFLAKKGLAAPSNPKELELLARQHGYDKPNAGDDPAYMATLQQQPLPGWSVWCFLLALIALWLATF